MSISKITITLANGEVLTLEFAFSDNGDTLTFTDDTGDQSVWTRRDDGGGSNDPTLENLQGSYELDENLSTGDDFAPDGFSIISTDLVIANMSFEVTVTAQVASSETFVIDDNTIRLTEDDGEITILTATLTETMLTLVDGDGNRFVFDRP